MADEDEMTMEEAMAMEAEENGTPPVLEESPDDAGQDDEQSEVEEGEKTATDLAAVDRKSTRLNSSH